MKYLILMLSLALLGLGCSDDGGSAADANVDLNVDSNVDSAMDADMADPAEDASGEVMEAGTPITAGMMADATAREVMIGAEPYLVSMPTGETNGFLRVVTTEADTDAIAFFQSTAVLTGIQREDMSSVAFASAGPNSFCATDIPEHFDLELVGAGTYFFQLTSAQPAWFFLSSAEGHTD